jgi:hypothetical protein
MHDCHSGTARVPGAETTNTGPWTLSRGPVFTGSGLADEARTPE